MKLTFAEYKDKVRGCWLGKNIGGVLGAPFEGLRGVFNVSGYVQDLSGDPPPNDDLDLQLIWLNAAEKYKDRVNASILGEYWLSFVTPNWVEYGAGKNNLRMGLLPPLAGHVKNPYKDSCGCFIRSEIWASLAPGLPDLAARYAYEDAVVDHAGEGMYAEIFCAVLESAAFVESDRDKLINIGLSYIPEDCDVVLGVKTAISAYKAGKSFEEARREVLTAVPGSFGVQNTLKKDIPTDVPIGEPGYDAPSNIGLMIIGWLYGENDFGKSLCIANNCGEDTDCTCATLGAILGIISGAEKIPEKWSAPLGDKISTCCINRTNGGLTIPQTVTELTDRILRLTPLFLGTKYCDLLAGPDGYVLNVCEAEALYCVKEGLYVHGIGGYGKSREMQIHELLKLSPFAVNYSFSAFDVAVDYLEEPFIKIGQNKKIKLTVRDNGNLDEHNQQWLTVKWYAPDGVQVLPTKEVSFFMQVNYQCKQELLFEINADGFTGGKLELLADISVNGRHSNGIVKVTLIPSIG